MVNPALMKAASALGEKGVQVAQRPMIGRTTVQQKISKKGVTTTTTGFSITGLELAALSLATIVTLGAAVLIRDKVEEKERPKEKGWRQAYIDFVLAEDSLLGEMFHS